jgi:hypothetical protein
MKAKRLVLCCIGALVALVGTVYAEPWQECGRLEDIRPLTCQIPGQPLTEVEYGIAYNSTEPVPVICTTWNQGVRIANKTPYFVFSDDPSQTMRYGGFVFYQKTAATDDGQCRGGYQHRYWFLGKNTVVEVENSNGCTFDQPVFCRQR